MLHLIIFTFGFFFGIGFATVGEWDYFVMLSLLSLFILGLRWPTSFALGLGFICGFWRMEHFELSLDNSTLPYGEWMEFEVQVLNVDLRDDHQNLIVVQEDYGEILIEFSPYLEFYPGDHLVLKGVLERIPEEDGVSYSEYLAKSQIFALMKNPKILQQDSTSANFFKTLFVLREKLQIRLGEVLFEPEASLASGILLGFRQGIPQALSEDFRKVGLTHIVAVSGYNISLLIAFVFWVFSFLSFKKRLLVSGFFIVLFVFFVGISAAVLRAGVMGILSLWALMTGRRAQVFFAVLWTAVFMLLWNPSLLLWDIGFQLSFAATVGLLVFVPVLDEYFPGKESKSFFREAFLVSSASQLATFPIIAYHFGRFSLISPLVNLLIAPFVPLAMLFSALALVFGSSFGLLARFFLKSIFGIAHLFARIPFAELQVDFPAWVFALTLLLQILTLLLFYKPKLWRAFSLSDAEVSSRVSLLGEERREKPKELPP